MSISLIVAMSENGVIGVDNRMPWHLSADLKRFRQVTLGKPILMAEGCTVVHSLAEALEAAENAPELMVIGGAALYTSFLSRAERLFLTRIHHNFHGDTFFPEIDWAEWREVARQDVLDDKESGLSYSFIDYQREARP